MFAQLAHGGQYETLGAYDHVRRNAIDTNYIRPANRSVWRTSTVLPIKAALNITSLVWPSLVWHINNKTNKVDRC